MNAINHSHIQAFAQADEDIQPDVYITYDAASNVTIYFEDDSLVLDMGYDD